MIKIPSNRNKNKKCIATKHAYDRAKQRLGWKKSVLEKMMGRAIEQGFEHGQTKGRLKKHLNQLWKDYRICNNMRIHGEVLFVFKDNLLITVYRLDNKYISSLSYLRDGEPGPSA